MTVARSRAVLPAGPAIRVHSQFSGIRAWWWVSVIGRLLGLILLLFLIAMVVRAVLDWTSVLTSGGEGASRAGEISHRVTEPVVGPVRRVLPPVRLGSVQLDLAFTVVFVATLILRSLVSYL